jgi:hypothetical protein
MLHCPANHTVKQLTTRDTSAGDGMASPADYLDKIFQIPFALTPPTPEAIASYLRSLLPLPGRADGLPPLAAGDDGAAAQRTNSGLPSHEQAGLGHIRSNDRIATPLPSLVPTSPLSSLNLVIPDLRPLGLQLTVHEVEFMMRLSAILPTPRAAKKLTNLYRLVRIRIPETQLADFTGSPSKGPYQIVQILLAMLVSSPEAAHQIFQQIMDEPPSSDILRILTATSGTYPKIQEYVRLSRQIALLVEQIPAVAGIKEYQRWCPVIARYSFHTRTLTNVAPQTSRRQVDASPLIDRW